MPAGRAGGVSARPQLFVAEGIAYAGGDIQAKQSSDGTGAMTLTMPGVIDNDFGIIFYYSDSNGGAEFSEVNTPTGWTQTFAPVADTGGRDRKMYGFHRTLSSGAANPSIVVNNGLARGRSAILVVFRGVNLATPFDATPIPDFDQNTPSPSSSPITTVTSGACIVSVLGFSAAAANLSSWAGAEPAGYTMGPSIVSSYGHSALAYLLDAGAAGVKSPGAWSPTTPASTEDCGNITYALRPS